MSEANKTGMPIRITLEPGIYYRCTCGKSQNLPFCDGTHSSGRQAPIRFEITAKQKVYLCTCGQTQTQPFCDQSCGCELD
jgi:CDGSH-type Zn-finger protein